MKKQIPKSQKAFANQNGSQPEYIENSYEPNIIKHPTENWGKELKHAKKNIQTVNKQKRKCLISLVIMVKEITIKTTMKYHYSHNSMATTKVSKPENTSGTIGFLRSANGNTKVSKSFWQYLVHFKTSILSDLVFLNLHTTPAEICAHEHQKINTRMFNTGIICNRAKLETTQISINSSIQK